VKETEQYETGPGVFPGFLGGKHVLTPAAQINGQPGHDVAVEIEADEERFKAG
jgi:hypothetical protein